MTLNRVPFIPPELETKRQEKLLKLATRVRATEVQFGTFCYPDDPERKKNKVFSVEWKSNDDVCTWIKFEYEFKLICVSVCATLRIHRTDVHNISIMTACKYIRRGGFEDLDPLRQHRTDGDRI
jgi:hypothetical protein